MMSEDVGILEDFRLVNKEIKPFSGAVVTYYLPYEVSRLLVQPCEGAEPPEQLHITLAYCGSAEKLTEVQRDVMLVVMQDFAKSNVSIMATVAGVGRFYGSEEEGDPIYASVDCVGLAELRCNLVKALEDCGVEVSKLHGFTPHITLFYTKAPDISMPVVPKVSFCIDKICVDFAGEKHLYPFNESLTNIQPESVSDRGLMTKGSGIGRYPQLKYLLNR